MKTGRVTRVRNKVISFLLALCMVFTMIPGNDWTVHAADPEYWVMDTELKEGAKNDAQGWAWEESSKTLTFSKSTNAIVKNGIAVKLPGDSTIVLNDGIRVEVKGISEKLANLGVGIYCTGNLTIKGNGALQISAEVPAAVNMPKGEAVADYNEKLSALICDGKLEIGEEGNKTAPYIYMAIAGGAYSDKTLCVKSNLTGRENPAVEIKSGQVNFGSAGDTEGKIWIGESGTKDGYVKLTGQSVLRDATTERLGHDDNEHKTVCAHCTLYYENGKHGNLREGFYYGTNDYHRYVKYLSEVDLVTVTNATKNDPLRELIGSKADLTVRVLGRDDFIGWSLDKEGASGVLRSYTIPKPSDGDYEASIQASGTIYLYAMYGEKSNYKEATPSAAINYKESKLTALVEGGTYTIKIADKDGSNEKTLLTNSTVGDNGEFAVDDLSNYFENGGKITVVKSGVDGFGDSSEQTLEILTAGDAPTLKNFTITNPTNDNPKTNVKISSAYEYKKAGETSWTAASSEDATKGIDLDPGASIEVRKAISEDAPASKSLTITAKKMEDTPDAGVNYKESKITKLVAGGKYTITAGNKTIIDKLEASADGAISVPKLSDYYGQTIKIVKNGDGTTTSDSAAKEITLASQADAPNKNEFSVTEATKENPNATITGIGSKYEYSDDGGKTWKDGSDTTAAGVSVKGGESVLVRVGATEDTPASKTYEIKTQPAPNQEDTPEAIVNYKDKKLTNLAANAKYSIEIADGGYREYTANSDGEIIIENFTSHYGDNVSIIKKASDETKTDSAEQKFTLKSTDDAKAPNRDDYTVTEAVGGRDKATIEGITPEQEYSEDGGKTWLPGDGTAKDVPAGTDILIRNAATEDTPESSSITITTKAAQTQEEKPQDANIDYLVSALTGLKPNKDYIVTVDGETIVQGKADDNGRLKIDDVIQYAGKELSVVKKGDGTTTYDSEPQVIVVKEKKDAPSIDEFEVVNPSNGETTTTVKGITAEYEYQIGNGTWQDGTGADVAVPEQTEIKIRVKATESEPESEILTITTKKPEDKPKANINYQIPGLTGLKPGEKYEAAVDGEIIAAGEADENGNLKIDELLSNAGKEISVVKKGTDTTCDSQPQIIQIKEKGSAPSESDFEVNGPTADKPGTTVKNITDEYEYRIGDGEWTDGTGEDVEIPAGETIEIRKKATEDTPESESLKIKAKDTIEKTPEEKPEDASVDYTIPGLTGLKPGEKYEVTVDEEVLVSKEADENGNLKIDDLLSNAGKEISVVKKGDGETTTDSDAKIIFIETKGDAPSKDNFEVIDPTGGKTETVIKNITDEYEYRIGDGEWTDGTGEDVEVPAGETIEIRKKATTVAPESESVTIKAKDVVVKTPESTPTAGVDYKAEQITGLVPNAEYVIKVDGKTIIFKADAAGKTDLNAYYGKTISIIKKGDGTTTEDSAEQKLTVLAKQAAPSDDQFDVMPDENGGSVTIKNVSPDYEYSINNGLSWTTGNGSDVTVPVGTIVLIRRKATATAPASNTVVIKTTAYPTLSTVDKQITSTNTDKGDVAGSTFAPICLKATGKSKAIKLTWKKVKDASGYIVYGSACGKNNKMKKLATLAGSKKTFTEKKLKANTYYKYMVVAYKTIDGKDYAISKSKVAHASTTQKAKYGNPKKVNLKSSKVTVKKGKKKTIKPKLVLTKKKMRKHIAKFRYESANTAVATVTKKGVIKGVKKGKTYVYAYAQNGVYKKIKVTVK